MIFLLLFWTFFKIGLFTLGGGYAMIPVIQSSVTDELGWLSRGELLDFIGVAESSPGPLAINLATFIGSLQGAEYGIWGSVLGAICATFGVVLPSFIIILIIAVFFGKFADSPVVQGFLYGVRPVIIGLVAASAVSLGLSVVFPALDLKCFSALTVEGFDAFGLGIMAITFVLWGFRFGNKKKSLHPILLIIIAAALGILLFGVLGL